MHARPGRGTPDRCLGPLNARRSPATGLAVGNNRRALRDSAESLLPDSLRPRWAGPGLIEEAESYTGAPETSIPKRLCLWKSRMVLVPSGLQFDTNSQIGAANLNKLKDFMRSPNLGREAVRTWVRQTVFAEKRAMDINPGVRIGPFEVFFPLQAPSGSLRQRSNQEFPGRLFIVEGIDGSGKSTQLSCFTNGSKRKATAWCSASGTRRRSSRTRRSAARKSKC